MPNFSTSLHLPSDIAEERVDEIGRAVLIEQARKEGLSITGEVTRVLDQFVVGVMAPDHTGQMVVTHVPIDSPLAGGRTDPDARSVTWAADASEVTTDPALVIVGTVDGSVSRAVLPPSISEHGGMVAFRHNLDSDDVLVLVLDASGDRMGYEFAVEIDNNEQQVLVPRGAHTIQASSNDEEPTK